MDALTLSLGRNILKPGSREWRRMHLYAKELGNLHIIVLTRKEHRFKTEIHEDNLHIYPTNSRGRFMMLVDTFFIGRRIAKQQRETSLVISSQDPFELGLVGLLLSRYKKTRFHVQIHGDYFGSRFWRGYSLVKSLRLILASFVLKRATGIRVVSLRIKRSLIERRFDASRITVLPIRPELEVFLKTPHEVGEHNPFVFLIASRFSHEKNIPLMLRAFAKVLVQHPHIHLRIVGKGEAEKKILSLIAELDIKKKMTLIPWTETLEDEMQGADTFLLGSDHEAYGLTLIEALAVGVPLITTDVGCVGEVVKNDTHGIVVPVRDEDAFASAMERMIIDTAFRIRCSKAGRATARTLAKTSEEEYARAWVATLESDREAV